MEIENKTRWRVHKSGQNLNNFRFKMNLCKTILIWYFNQSCLSLLERFLRILGKRFFQYILEFPVSDWHCADFHCQLQYLVYRNWNFPFLLQKQQCLSFSGKKKTESQVNQVKRKINSENFALVAACANSLFSKHESVEKETPRGISDGKKRRKVGKKAKRFWRFLVLFQLQTATKSFRVSFSFWPKPGRKLDRFLHRSLCCFPCFFRSSIFGDYSPQNRRLFYGSRLLRCIFDRTRFGFTADISLSTFSGRVTHFSSGYHVISLAITWSHFYSLWAFRVAETPHDCTDSARTRSE